MTMQSTVRRPAPGFASHPGYQVEIEPCAKRVRVAFNQEIVADSTRIRLLRETAHTPVYYFPPEDVRLDLTVTSTHRSHCPFKGEASYRSLVVADQRADNVIWSYEAPFIESVAIEGYLGFYWERMDHWYEEDEEVFVHARDPHVRIDVLASSRPLKVVAAGLAVAESRRGLFLFETGLPVRYYLPRDDVRMDLLRPSETKTACPYKGRAQHWSLHHDGQVKADIAWSYAEPLPEAGRIKDYICFYDERVDSLFLDGSPVDWKRLKMNTILHPKTEDQAISLRGYRVPR